MKNLTTSRTSGDDSRSTLMRIGLLVAIACMVATVVWLGARSRTTDAGTSDKTSGDTASQTVESTTVTQVAPRTAPADGVIIPTGSDQVDGYPTGFPATDLGAVGLQVEVAKAQVGFDYDQAVTVAGLYADTDDKAIFEERALDAVALRRQQAGVAKDGEVPAPASYAVNLLSYVTLTNADGEVKDGLYAGTQLMRWVEADSSGNKVQDWRLVQGTSKDIEYLVSEGQPKAVAPGTPEFEQAGWVPINGAPQ